MISATALGRYEPHRGLAVRNPHFNALMRDELEMWLPSNTMDSLKWRSVC